MQREIENNKIERERIIQERNSKIVELESTKIYLLNQIETYKRMNVIMI